MPEPVRYSQPNQCFSEEPNQCSIEEPNLCTAGGAVSRPALTSSPPVSTSAPPTAPPAVQQLVATHPSSQQAPHNACRTEGVVVASAATRAIVSLVKLAASAPTEVGLAATIPTFIADAAALGAATAQYVNCRNGTQ